MSQCDTDVLEYSRDDPTTEFRRINISHLLQLNTARNCAMVDDFFSFSSPRYRGFNGTIPEPHPASNAPCIFDLTQPISVDFLDLHSPKWAEHVTLARSMFKTRYPLMNMMDDDYETNARQDVYRAALVFRSRRGSGPFAQPGMCKSSSPSPFYFCFTFVTGVIDPMTGTDIPLGSVEKPNPGILTIVSHIYSTQLGSTNFGIGYPRPFLIPLTAYLQGEEVVP
jgi:hypothetical protein